MRIQSWQRLLCARSLPAKSWLRPVPAWRQYQSSISSRKWSTPLAESLAKAITTTGPISVASFMRQCLTAPDVGYYTQMNSSGRDPFGQTGDFITAPEISQVFGELVGLWVVAEWMAQGRKRSGVQLVELGPGRGTLMDDMLRTMQSFRLFIDSVETIYMLEASPMLREKQHKLLCGDYPLQETTNGFESRIKHASGNRIVWYEDMSFLPSSQNGQSPFIIAHEFFDALPIHIFQSMTQTSRSQSTITTSTTAQARPSLPRTEWRELVVSVAAPDPSAILSPSAAAKEAPEFELSISKGPTAHSTSLPTLSPRYKSVLPIANSTIEISPQSQSLTSHIAKQISGNALGSTGVASHKDQPSGAALIIDYGTPSTIPTNSLRGIKQHKLVSPLSEPGNVDISASVDFVALADAAIDASPGVEVHGPARQADWLRAMGGKERVEALLKAAGTDANATGRGNATASDAAMTAASQKDDKQQGDAVERIEGAWNRLVDTGPKGMGGLYHVMAIVPEGRVRQGGVVGFGGHIR